MGAPTFDAWIVRNEFADKNPDVVTAFVKVTGDAYADYLKDPKAWLATPGNIDKVAKLVGSKPEDVAIILAGYKFPTLAEQASDTFLGGGTAKAIADASTFLKEQKKIEEVLGDYSPYVNADFVKQGAATTN